MAAAADILQTLMRSEQLRDKAQERWTYRERKVNSGRAARLVYDIRVEGREAYGPGIGNLVSEDVAAYICALHNEQLARVILL